jgi:hypothetical protein
MGGPTEVLMFVAIFAMFLTPLVYIAVVIFRAIRAPEAALTSYTTVKTAWPTITLTLAVIGGLMSGVPYSVHVKALPGLFVLGTIEWVIRRWLIRRA